MRQVGARRQSADEVVVGFQHVVPAGGDDAVGVDEYDPGFVAVVVGGEAGPPLRVELAFGDVVPHFDVDECRSVAVVVADVLDRFGDGHHNRDLQYLCIDNAATTDCAASSTATRSIRAGPRL